MPYLDQGEFYSEFGSFEVSITLPRNYVVGATGTLQEIAEKEWLLKKAAVHRELLTNTDYLPSSWSDEEDAYASSQTTKTLTYTAENVHDFAWFADKEFRVLHDTIQLAEGAEPIDVWSMYTETEAELWSKSTDYLKRAVRFYSDQLGDYPYPQVTGVQSALSAGGGMEYPMITVIGLSYDTASLDEVLAHEVGHNWFYGILASNERDHAWMDEGLNSFYERRYMATYYPNGKNSTLLGLTSDDLDRQGYRFYAMQGRDQAPDTRADSLSKWNYWIQSYSKPSLALQELEAYVGSSRLDAAMQVYFDVWQFKHPQPADFFRIMETNLGSTIQPWFSEALLTTKTSDWKLGNLKVGPEGHQSIAHSGKRMAPATAQLEQADGKKLARTLEPGEDVEAKISVPNVVAVTLPERDNPLDLNYGNNLSGWSLPVPTFKFARPGPGYRTLTIAPIAGYNIHDGFQAGIALSNRNALPRKLEWIVAPLYGFNSKTLNGFGGGRYRVARPFNGVQQMIFSAGTQQWSDFTLARTDQTYSYARSAFKVEVHLDHPPITERESRVFGQLIYLNKERPLFEVSPDPVGIREESNYFVRLGFESKLTREINPFAYSLVVEYKNRDKALPSAFEADHVRLDATVSGGLQYEKGRFFRYRVFGAYFLKNDLRDQASYPSSTISLVDNAESDYRRDGLYFGRKADIKEKAWPDQQVDRRQGGFRVPISSPFTAFTSNNYMLATNIDVDLPLGDIPVPLGVFMDAGYYAFKATTSDPTTGTLSWVGGLSLTAADGRIGLFLPLVMDPDTKDLLEVDQRSGLLDKMTVRLQLDGWLPWKWVDSVL